MRAILRDLLRQRLRTGLTVSGVGLGIFTLVVLGSLGEHFRDMVEEAKVYSRGLVRLYTKTNAAGINPGITDDVRERLAEMPEVAAVAPSLMLMFDGFNLEDDPLSFMMPLPIVEGLPAEHAELLRGHGMELLEGRWLRKGDRRHAMVVDWIAQRRGLTVGGTVTIRHLDYEVVGIYHAPDTPAVPAGVVPYELLNTNFLKPQIERTQRYFRGLSQNPILQGALTLPPDVVDRMAEQFARQQGNLFRVHEIVPADRSRAGTQALAVQLRGELPDLAVIDPDKIEERMERAVAIFLVITMIVTVLSTVVGGLLIVNTMAMAVIERRKEIAIRAAMGATPGQVAGEFVVESAALALVGALAGVVLGAVAIFLCEPWLLGQLETGARLFLITPRLILLALAYAVVMGVLAGGLPALRASRIDPAITLREL